MGRAAGLSPEAGEFPFAWERAYPSAPAGALARAVGFLLAGRGFRVEGPDDPSFESTAHVSISPEWTMVGVRDVVLDARRRIVGKAVLGAAVLLTVFILILMVSGVTHRALLEWLMTIDVFAGGGGLMLLRHPPKRVRRMVEARFTPEAGGVRVNVREGAGKVEDDTLFEWLSGETAELREEAVDELARSVAAQPGWDGNPSLLPGAGEEVRE